MPLTRDEILAKDDLPRELVAVPEWGDGASVIVRTLTVAEFLALSRKVDADKDNAFVHWIVATVVNEIGNLVFNDSDAAALAGKSVAAIQRITDVAQRLNVVAKADAEKNSQARSGSPIA